MKLYFTFVPLIIIAIIAGLGLAAGRGRVTPNAIYAAEGTYYAALQAADTYRHLCVGDVKSGTPAVLPPSCKTTLATIQADVVITDKAYQKIVGFETNPPAGTAAEFLAALTVLQAAIPVT